MNSPSNSNMSCKGLSFFTIMEDKIAKIIVIKTPQYLSSSLAYLKVKFHLHHNKCNELLC